MILVVDAYNVLKQAAQDEWISERDRDLFVKKLGRYARLKGHKVVVIFDGGDRERPVQELIHGTYVVYSGVHESADDFIKGYIERYQHDDLLLISSDRDLVTWAAQHGIESLGSSEFYKIVNSMMNAYVRGNRLRTPAQLIKITDVENPELDAVMHEQESGRVVNKDELPRGNRDRSAHTVSKKDKKIFKKIRKL